MKMKRVRRKITIVVRKGTRKLKDAERSGALEKWKNRIGLGLKVAEAAVVAGLQVIPVQNVREATAFLE